MSTNSSPEIIAAVLEIICRIGRCEPPQPDQDLFSTGLTSVTALPLLLELEDRFQITIPDERFIEARTARELGDIVSELQGR